MMVRGTRVAWKEVKQQGSLACFGRDADFGDSEFSDFIQDEDHLVEVSSGVGIQGELGIGIRSLDRR
jgi:hypothetical protein